MWKELSEWPCLLFQAPLKLFSLYPVTLSTLFPGGSMLHSSSGHLLRLSLLQGTLPPHTSTHPTVSLWLASTFLLILPFDLSSTRNDFLDTSQSQVILDFSNVYSTALSCFSLSFFFNSNFTLLIAYWISVCLSCYIFSPYQKSVILLTLYSYWMN